MSKSLGNFFTIRDVLKHYDAEVAALPACCARTTAARSTIQRRAISTTPRRCAARGSTRRTKARRRHDVPVDRRLERGRMPWRFQARRWTTTSTHRSRSPSLFDLASESQSRAHRRCVGGAVEAWTRCACSAFCEQRIRRCLPASAVAVVVGRCRCDARGPRGRCDRRERRQLRRLRAQLSPKPMRIRKRARGSKAWSSRTAPTKPRSGVAASPGDPRPHGHEPLRLFRPRCRPRPCPRPSAEACRRSSTFAPDYWHEALQPT